ncbi:MAG: hypothetical protein K6G13_07750 [Agathobacter sp.]|uniref:hypothetical protein n=1 Tax=Agathobacter sp. TaxID=2021311 RepID=UPI00258B7953|nr:hypothetical protein [Agathobacter sp.]MCR5677905.1 hypothetical protein [Agathobacter sp.]
MKGNKGIRIAILIVIYLLWLGCTYYVLLPALNPHSIGFWLYLALVVLLPPALVSLFHTSDVKVTKKGVKMIKTVANTPAKILFGAIGACIIIILIGDIAGAKLFHAKGYASILKTEDYEFSEDINQQTALSMIALMDTNSAIRLGNREIGSLSDLVSQYDVSDDYSQIDRNGAPQKVSALRYAGFFKWWGNRDKGVPGYVAVDPVEQNADYVKLEKGMRYVPSAYFNTDLERNIRFHYPTAIFGNTHFEVDEEGNPYYVASVYTYKIGLFGGDTVKGAIICDPTNGDCDYYDVAEIPTWVDDVFDGELLTKQYNWTGELGNGFWNSLFGKKGCKKCTETYNSEDENYVADYGYVAKDGDIWIYTGITSVNDDASNIGFILVNQRTSEAHYYSIAGADENSAMSAAEGEVQEKGYQASFPSLINVYDKPTYVMVLKDASGIVKLYAMVNVEQYNIVTTASNLDDCFSKYKKLVKAGGDEDAVDDGDTNDDGDETELKDPVDLEVTIASIEYVAIRGDTYVYLEAEDGTILRQKFADNESLISLRIGDKIKVNAQQSETGTYYINTISK